MTTRLVYLEELSELKFDVIRMGSLLEESIEDMMKALRTLDADMAGKVIKGDDEIDQLENEIEQYCINLIAKQQPVATDLRKICSIMRLIADIERIADHCSDISEYILLLAGNDDIKMPKYVEEMAQAVKSMVARTIDSFVKEDAGKAQEVVKDDDAVDDYYDKIKEELCTQMEANPKRIRQYVQYLQIIKYLERMADHSTNIAKWITFIVTGELRL